MTFTSSLGPSGVVNNKDSKKESKEKQLLTRNEICLDHMAADLMEAQNPGIERGVGPPLSNRLSAIKPER